MVNNYPDFYKQVMDTMAKYGKESPNTMGGGPAVVYGSQALEALEQFESKVEV